MNPDQQNQHLAPPVVGQDVVATPPTPTQQANLGKTAQPAAAPAPVPVHHQPPAVNSQKARSGYKTSVLAIIMAILISLGLAVLALLTYKPGLIHNLF